MTDENCQENGRGECCINNICVTDCPECTYDVECPPNQVCSDGKCVEKFVCTTDEDCSYMEGCCKDNFCYSSSSAQCSQGDCANGWASFRGFCYKLVMKKLSWAEAWHHCRDQLSAILASIHSNDENCFVARRLHPPGYIGNFWLDGRFIFEFKKKTSGCLLLNVEMADRLIWTDGSKMDYHHWDRKSIPRPLDSPTKLCLHGKGITTPAPFCEYCDSWGNQVDCTEPLNFVCKRRLTPLPPCE